MSFPYYDNLSAAKKRIYRKSDAVESVPVKDPGRIHPVVIKLRKSFADDKRSEVAKYCSEICRQVCEGLGTQTLIVKIRSKRPSSSAEELHGLYEWPEGETPVLTVWMKTAVKRQVVAFKSFIRTVLHELCHHLDYTYFDLEDSFHTEGFFKRESALYKQIIPLELQKKEPRKKEPSRKRNIKQKSEELEQMELF
jgi:molybdopterin-guanine dinucleotide biosynthesis protein A